MLLFHLAVLLFCVGAEEFACDDAGKKCAVMYKQKRCGSKRFSIDAGQDIKDLEDFSDSIQSLVVTRDCMLVLYEKTHFKGNFRVFVGNYKDEQYYKLDETTLADATNSATCICGDLDKIRNSGG